MIWIADLLLPDPVLLCDDLGTKREAAANAGNDLAGGAIIRSSGHHSMSVKEAVRIAQSNNFMGLVCSSRLLVRPLLVHPLEAKHTPSSYQCEKLYELVHEERE